MLSFSLMLDFSKICKNRKGSILLCFNTLRSSVCVDWVLESKSLEMHLDFMVGKMSCARLVKKKKWKPVGGSSIIFKSLLELDAFKSSA